MALFAVTADDWVKFVGPVAGALVTGIIGLLAWWLTRKRPNKIEVRDVEFLSLIRVGESIKPRIQITLDGNPVKHLSQLEVAITNQGSETVKDVNLHFIFPRDATVLECELSGVENAKKQIESPTALMIWVPFLNAKRPHGDVLTAKILCDGNALSAVLTGRGEGWSAKRTTLRYQVAFTLLRGAFFTLSPPVLSLFLITPLSNGMRKSLQLDERESSWQVTCMELGIALLASVVSATGFFRMTRRLKRFRRDS